MDTLASFYAERIARFPDEVKTFERYQQLVTPSNAEFHKYDWECRQQQEDIASLNEAIKAADLEYVQTKLKLNDCLSYISEAKDNSLIRQKQIQKLSELVKPVEHDTTYVVREISSPKDKTHSQTPKSKSGKSLQIFNEVNESNVVGVFNSQSQTEKENKPIYTKFVKDGEIFEHERSLEEMTKRITLLTNSILVSLVQADDFSRLITSEPQAAIEQSKSKAFEISQNVDKLDHECFLSASELLRLRLNILISQREEIQEIASLKEDQAAYIEKERHLKELLTNEVDSIKKKVQSELFQIKANFNEQFSALEAKMKTLNKREKKADKLLSGEVVEQLKLSVAQSKDKYEKLRRRNALELEGYQNEINLLRQRLKNLKIRIDQKFHRNAVSSGLQSKYGDSTKPTRPRRVRSMSDVIASASKPSREALAAIASTMEDVRKP